MSKLALIERLELSWSNCSRCALHRTRQNVVHWRGNPSASLMLVGEAPGADEDREGRPFIGRSGRLLDELLTGNGLDPAEDVIITNIVACRPPGNRVPFPDEIRECRRRLDFFTRIVRPRAIVLLGRVAARYGGIYGGGCQGCRCEVLVGSRSVPAVATYHPSYLLRTQRRRDHDQLSSDLRLATEIGDAR